MRFARFGLEAGQGESQFVWGSAKHRSRGQILFSLQVARSSTIVWNRVAVEMTCLKPLLLGDVGGTHCGVDQSGFHLQLGAKWVSRRNQPITFPSFLASFCLQYRTGQLSTYAVHNFQLGCSTVRKVGCNLNPKGNIPNTLKRSFASRLVLAVQPMSRDGIGFGFLKPSPTTFFEPKVLRATLESKVSCIHWSIRCFFQVG